MCLTGVQIFSDDTVRQMRRLVNQSFSSNEMQYKRTILTFTLIGANERKKNNQFSWRAYLQIR